MKNRIMITEPEAEFIDTTDPVDLKAIGSMATEISHQRYHIAVTPIATIPDNVFADKYVACLRFGDKAHVYFTIANWKTKKLDYLSVLGSINYTGEKLRW